MTSRPNVQQTPNRGRTSGEHAALEPEPLHSPLIEISGLVREYRLGSHLFRRNRRVLHAVDGVSFRIERGQTFGLVGESGCGKTTIARQILRMENPPSGTIRFEGSDISKLSRQTERNYRKRVQAVLQDPYSSLNPRMTVSSIIEEPMLVHTRSSKAERRQRVDELLNLVGLNASMARLFPHQFSGGQRQRIAIARALSSSPELIVLDEPVSALDVSIRGQILNVLKDIQDSLHVSYLLIAHDLPSVAFMSDTIGIMYLGKLVEMAPSYTLVEAPLHPYTQALVAAALPPEQALETPAIPIKGEVASPIDPPRGCRFHTRCSFVMEICRVTDPDWKEVAKDHFVACHLH